jgi:alanine dehydrogenase
VKVSGFVPANREVGLESHQAVVVLLDEASGRPKAVVDGNEVTWLRTAMAGAAGTRALARADARSVLVVGNGLQAEAQVRSHAWLLKERRPRFLVHAPRDDEHGRKSAEFRARLHEHGIVVEPAEALAEALAEADVVVTATPAVEPLLHAGAVRPGTHITAMGADAPGKRELSDELVAASRLVADDPTQSRLFGEGQGLRGDAAERVTTLGEILAGDGFDRGADEITVFDSTGLGLHDVVTAAVAVERARERGVGTHLRF